MKDSDFEIDGDEFPINSELSCGQSTFCLGQTHMTFEDAAQTLEYKALVGNKPGRFLPKPFAQKNLRTPRFS